MSSCQNCKALMVALKSEIQELHHQQQLLLHQNEQLMIKINQQQTSDQDVLYWKQKYKDQKEVNDAISSKIIKDPRSSVVISQRKNHRPFTPQKSLQSFITLKTARKENISDKSARKMSQLMKAIVLQKFDNGLKSKKMLDRKQGKREIVLRIVDDRLNRPF